MKKVLTVSLLGLLLSIPSTIYAQASWYGSIRTGIESNDLNNTGVVDFDSRWGIQGSSEVSEGLTAVYRYERRIDSSDASEPFGRLSYVGLSGSFGTVTIGQVWGAPYNHFGGIVDQALNRNYGLWRTISERFSNAVSYAVSVGNVSLQADAIMDQSTSTTVDEFTFGATLGGLMETGSIAIAHRKHPDQVSPIDSADVTKRSANFVAGNYGIGDMTVYLGYSLDSRTLANCTLANTGQGTLCIPRRTEKTTFAGVHGGVRDTGVNYVFTVRKIETSIDTYAGTASTRSTTRKPWTFGLSKSLGGGASVKFEHHDPDSGIVSASNTAVWLQVDF